jgi:hypothetical protein
MSLCIGLLEAAVTASPLHAEPLLTEIGRLAPLQTADHAERWSLVARVLAGVNLLLLLGLCYVWGRNYAEFRSKHTLGLLVFAVLLLGRNLWALYIYQFDPLLAAWFASEAVPDPAWTAMLTLHLLETLALAFLAWVTWD